MNDQKKTKFYGWRNVVILFSCYCLIYGIVFYGYAVLFPATLKALGWARGDASVANTIRGFMVGFAAPVVALMVNRWGTKNTIMAGSTIVMVGLLILGTIMDQLWVFILGWGVIVGFGLCAAGQVPIMTSLTFWFSRKRGLVQGIVGTGASVGGFIAQPLFAWVMNQTGSWKAGWITAAGIAFVGLIGIIWLKSKPEDYGQSIDGINPADTEEATGKGRKKTPSTYRTVEIWTTKESIRTCAFWFVLYAWVLVAMALYLVVSHGVLHLMDSGYKRMEAAYVISFFALSMGIGRVVVGYLVDVVEGRLVNIVIMAAMMAGLYGFWKASGLNILVVSTCVLGMCLGGGISLALTTVGNYFGPSAYASNIGFMYPFNVGFGSIVPMAAGYLHDSVKNYDMAFIMLIVLSGVSVVSLFFAGPPPKPATNNK